MFTTDEGKRFIKFAGFAVILLTVFLALQSLYTMKSFSYLGHDAMNQNVISVTGEGEVFSVPDIAMFTFGSTADAKTVKDAQDQVTKKLNAAFDILKKAGIAEKDIKTVDYSVYPKYEYSQASCSQGYCPPGKQNLVGYTVTQSASVKVREVAKAGDILGSLGGLNLTNVSGLQFTVDDETALQAQARAKAIADAKAKAKVLASQLGVRLGKVMNFSESGNYPVPYYKAALDSRGGVMANEVATPTLPAGENKILSNVIITYEIR